MALIQAGALSYVFFADIGRKRRWRDLALETRIILVTNAFFLVGAAVVFLAAEWNGSLSSTPVAARPLAALFQSVSARTAGYATVSFADVTNITLFTWVAVMFVGGASGSTAGGVKLTTVGVVALAVVSTVRGQPEPQVFGRRIPSLLIYRAMAVIALMFLAHFAATLALTISQHLSGGDEAFIALLFEAMSALATAGLSTGITPDLATPAKLILCLTMIFGRLGPLTAAYALQVRQHAVRYRFPEEPVRIG
jgi:trk system potassium uptake protein TrkH